MKDAVGRATTFAVAILGFVIALHPLASEDLFWHLAAGRWILDHGAIPRTDVLTYTMTDRPWTNLQWAGDVGAAALWRWAGADGLVLVKSLAWAGIGALLVAAGRAAGANAGAAGLAATLALLASAERTLERPESASALLLASTTLLAWRHRARPSRALALAPALHLAWANLHSLAFLGPATLALFALVARIERRGAAPSFALAAVASAVALLANPFGLATWTFPRTLLTRISGEEDVFSRILEFGSPASTPGDPALRAFWIFCALCAGIFVAGALLGQRRTAPSSLALLPSTATCIVVALPFLALALLARRNIPLFVIAATPLLAARLSYVGSFFPLPRNDFARRGWAAFPSGLALVLTAAVLAGASPELLGLWRDRGLGVAPGVFPESALRVADEIGAFGPVFNDLEFGGYMSWRDSRRPPFIDGRLEVCGPERLNAYIEAHRDPVVWNRLETSWKFDTLVLAHGSRGTAAFLRARVDEGAWTLASLTPEAALLVRANAASVHPGNSPWDSILAAERGPEPGAGRSLAGIASPIDRLLRLLQGRPRIAPIRAATRLANAWLTLDQVEAAREGYERVLAASPLDPEALFNRALCDLRAGNPETARLRWIEARPLVDRETRRRIDETLARLGGSGAPSSP